MNGPVAGPVNLVPGPPGLATLHADALPQKDQLCGAFWGSLTLTAAGHPADQDVVARRAGTTLAEGDPSAWLPPGASPRADYRLRLPVAADEARSGTSAAGLARAVEELSGGGLAVVPVAGPTAGPWTAASVMGLVETVAAGAPESAPAGWCVLVANLRTGRLWGSRPGPKLLLDHLAGEAVDPPAPDWDCGHFVGLAGAVGGPDRGLVVVRDTYRQLGWDGHHLQPPGAVAAALARGDGGEGGVLCVCESAGAAALRARLEEAGFGLRPWDNGSADGSRGSV